MILTLNHKHYVLAITVVWEKFIVENIYVKIIRCKNFSSLLASNKIFYGENFLPLNFFQFKLVAVSVGQKPLHIKMEFCERNSCVCVPITTRDA